MILKFHIGTRIASALVVEFDCAIDCHWISTPSSRTRRSRPERSSHSAAFSGSSYRLIPGTLTAKNSALAGGRIGTDGRQKPTRTVASDELRSILSGLPAFYLGHQNFILDPIPGYRVQNES